MKGIPHTTISKQMLALLFCINREPGQPMTYYSERMMISKSNLTVLSDKMINKGLIERLLDPQDRRIISLVLTEQGKQQLRNHKEEMKQILIRNFEALSDEDIKRLNELLEEMKVIFNKIRKKSNLREHTDV